MAHSRKYAINGDQNVSSTAITALILTTTTAIEPSIYFFTLGCEDTPADNSIIWYCQRTTAAGTSTAVTPLNLGPGTTASTATAGKNHTVEPTLTASAFLFRMGLNARSAHSVVLDPEGGLTAPATSNNGMAWTVTHASATPNMSITNHFRE